MHSAFERKISNHKLLFNALAEQTAKSSKDTFDKASGPTDSMMIFMPAKEREKSSLLGSAAISTNVARPSTNSFERRNDLIDRKRNPRIINKSVKFKGGNVPGIQNTGKNLVSSNKLLNSWNVGELKDALNEDDGQLLLPPSMKETVKTIHRLSNRKSPGTD